LKRTVGEDADAATEIADSLMDGADAGENLDSLTPDLSREPMVASRRLIKKVRRASK